MTKVELVNKIAAKAACSKKDAEKALNAVVNSITEALADGDKVTLVGFGTFEVKKRDAKVGINPRTKAQIKIPARKVPTFKAGKALKDVVAK